MTQARVHLFRSDDRRSLAQRGRRLALQAGSLAQLPRPVAGFWLRAMRRAQADHDTWSIDVACRPAELRVLLDTLAGAQRVAEIGTAAAWTTCCLTLAQPGREVRSWDVEAHPERERYLRLLSAEQRARVHLHDRPGGSGPADPPPVDAVFIDSSHEYDETVSTFRTWEPALAPGGIVAFHDWQDDAYPGVTEAVRDLGLQGEGRGHLFVWRKDGR
ncbi:MAG TPA: class I SAM-dependent methyltransferase [Solirubrobacteraceae bacterium]|nr:class I SAM-dependent methyltransferase [Solirubrobacteraceae bacterium]